MPSIFEQWRIGGDIGHKKARAQSMRASRDARRLGPPKTQRVIKPTPSGGSNVESFDEPVLRRVSKTGKKR